MTLNDILTFCNTLPATEETFPFDQRTLVFKVKGKMYALIDIHEPETINLKCDPEMAIELREKHDEIQPGYHMNKKHWNTVNLLGNLKESLIQEMIINSYELVIKSLPKKLRDELAGG
jgi:predicted DNA-binding protein (MmcQ/YjbR family)